MPKTVIISEKPSSAAKIASALAEGKPLKKELNGVPYYELKRDGNQIVVVPTLGHLFTLKATRPMRDYPVYELDWVPAYEADRGAARSQAFIDAIRELAMGADELIGATDYDIEGEVILLNVLRYLCGEGAVSRAKRMKFSTLTAVDLRHAYENLLPHLDFAMADSGVARHTLDWYWGMNLSAAMSSAVEAASGRFAKLSAGRVQSPLLKILAEREREIRDFKPEPFWTLSLLLELDGEEVVAEHATPRFFDRAEAERALEACKGRPARVAAIQTRQYRRPPPIPFDLGLLQSEAYRCFGYTPMRTQQIAQELYLAALVSYPRTASQKLPSVIGYRQIIEQLGAISGEYKEIADELLAEQELKPREGPKTDPAHPCFTADSAISLSNGAKMTALEIANFVKDWRYIEEKQSFAGDVEREIEVTAYDEYSKRIVRSKIVKVWKTPCRIPNILEITLEDGRKIRTTPNHYFYTFTIDGFQFTRADQLKVGRWLACKPEDKCSKEEHVPSDFPPFDKFDGRCGEESWMRIVAIEQIPAPHYVYDFEVENYHTFFVNGILVHNCIYPTGEKPGALTGPQQKLYDLIVRRLFSVFGKPALVESARVELDVGGQPFYVRGRRILDPGWLAYYGRYGAMEEVILPPLSEGQTLAVKEVKFEEKETQPPPRYNPASIVKELEARNLGTKGTRAFILQNVYDRGYISGQQIAVTHLGMKVIDALLKHCPEIASEELTAQFEREMEAIRGGGRTVGEVLERAKSELSGILKGFRGREPEIGMQLSEALRATKQRQRIIGPCPRCGGELRIITSRRGRKRFAGCSNYPGCASSFPLPRSGSIIPLGKICEQCGTPIIQVGRAGARPYRMCLDPGCPSKEGWKRRKSVRGGA